MLFIKKYSVILFGFILFPSNISGLDLLTASQVHVLTENADSTADPSTAEIEMDYFYGREVLRSPQNMKCHTLELKKECRATCGPDNYGCIFDECVCLDRDLKMKAKKKDGANLPSSKQEIKMMLNDFEDLVGVLRRYLNEQDADIEPEVELEEHPALRHHIAHFCPNLGVARTCIRKCMKVGKPAFCGKDHNCYCGHRYSERDVDIELDANEVYDKFRDIYAKYFGTADPVKNGK